MTNLKLIIASNYRSGFLTSSMIENEIKIIKKMNTVFGKLEKTKREVYISEIKNNLQILNNNIKIGKIIPVFKYFIEEKYHTELTALIEEVLRDEIFTY